MRKAKVKRKTTETDVTVELDLDGSGQYDVNTSIPFLDHMLSLFSMHGLFDLKIASKGDIEIDYHHLMEDIGITLGDAIGKALGDKKGIHRYGSALIPMDESLAEVVLDLSGRPFLEYRVDVQSGQVKDLEVSLFEDFFRALSVHSMMNLHIMIRHGRDLHHIYEAIFKACGRALHGAVVIDKRRKGVPSTKGTL
jgi:imidazoleglycerol-phosphate dehydratase